MNQWTGYGNLTSKPTLRDVGNSQVANFTVACNRSYKPKGSDEFKNEATFVRCEVWDTAAARVAACDKGDALIVRGELRNDNWEDKEGNKRSDLRCRVERFRVVRRKSEGSSRPQQEEQAPPTNESAPEATNAPAVGPDGQPIPF